MLGSPLGSCGVPAALNFCPWRKVSFLLLGLEAFSPCQPARALRHTKSVCIHLPATPQESYCEILQCPPLGTPGLQRETGKSHLFSLPKCHGQLFMAELTGCVCSRTFPRRESGCRAGREGACVSSGDVSGSSLWFQVGTSEQTKHSLVFIRTHLNSTYDTSDTVPSMRCQLA